MPTYEYASVIVINATNWGTIRDLPADSRPAQTWTTTFYVWLPGATAAIEHDSTDIKLVDLFTKLGHDGWELTTSQVLNTVVTSGDYYGWSEVASPVRERYVFMRDQTH